MPFARDGAMLIYVFTALQGIEESNASFLLHTTCRYIHMDPIRGLLSSNTSAARIITHAPLRAKEASPFVGGNQYPVVVRCPGSSSRVYD